MRVVHLQLECGIYSAKCATNEKVGESWKK